MPHKFLKITPILILLLNSCSKHESVDGYKKALYFHENYTTEFFESDLNNYQYHPRTQYDFLAVEEENSYRVLVRGNSNLLVISAYNFAERFNLPLDTNIVNGSATLNYENSEFTLEINNYDGMNYLISGNPIEKTIETNIRYVFPEEVIKNNPIAYFNSLEKLRNKFGIINYHRDSNGEVLWIYFTSFDYLIFIPDNFKFGANYKDHWKEKLKNGLKLDQNWYYFKNDKPLDVG